MNNKSGIYILTTVFLIGREEKRVAIFRQNGDYTMNSPRGARMKFATKRYFDLSPVFNNGDQVMRYIDNEFPTERDTLPMYFMNHDFSYRGWNENYDDEAHGSENPTM